MCEITLASLQPACLSPPTWWQSCGPCQGPRLLVLSGWLSLGWCSIPSCLLWPQNRQCSPCRMLLPTRSCLIHSRCFPRALQVPHPHPAPTRLTEPIRECVEIFSIQKTVCMNGVGGGSYMFWSFSTWPLLATREVSKLIRCLDWFLVLHFFLGMVGFVPCPCSLTKIFALTGRHL